MRRPFAVLRSLFARLFSWNKEIGEGLDCYDPETRVFPGIATKVRVGRELSKRDVLLILKWKTNRLQNYYSETIADENMVVINQAIIHASSHQVEALKKLTGIKGIKLAVATAILTVCYPDTFSIIDERALEMLDLFPARLPLHKRTGYNADDWGPEDYLAEFLPKVRNRSREWGRTLRETDRALWGLSVNKKIQEIIAKS